MVPPADRGGLRSFRCGAPFDFVFIDGDKEEYAEYLEWAIQLGRQGTLIVADNVVRGGEVANRDSRDPRVQGVRAFLEKLGSDPGVTASALQTVGAEGNDGFASARVGKGIKRASGTAPQRSLPWNGMREWDRPPCNGTTKRCASMSVIWTP